MIKTSEVLPRIYSTSHDFQIFEALLDVFFSDIDVNCLKLQGLHSPRQCFTENLGMLANLFQLKTSNRQLLKWYRLMLKSKGTTEAVEAGLFYCGAVLSKETREIESNTVSSEYARDIKENQITYYVDTFNQFDTSLFNTIKKMICPFNIQLQVLPISERPKA